MKTIRWIALAAVMGALAGCSQSAQPTMEQSKADANKRWTHTRAQMQYGVAVEHLKAGQLDKAKVKIMEALALDENYTDARLLLGKVEIEMGQYGLARAELDRVCTEKPESCEAFYLLGVAQEREGKLNDALESYRQAFVRDNTFVPALLASAEVLVAQGKSGEAQKFVESAISVSPEDPAVNETAGRLAMSRRDFVKAVEYFTLACDQDPKNLFYQQALATATYLNGRHKDAAELLQKLVDNSDHKATALEYGMLGNSYLVLSRAKEARDAFIRQTELAPNDSSAFTNLAKAALQLGDNQRAVLAAQQALRLKSDNVDATIVLSYSLICGGHTDKALDVLKSACQTRPNNATLQCLLGRAYASAGDEVQADKCYSIALELEPSNVLARELLAASPIRKASNWKTE